MHAFFFLTSTELSPCNFFTAPELHGSCHASSREPLSDIRNESMQFHIKNGDMMYYPLTVQSNNFH